MPSSGLWEFGHQAGRQGIGDAARRLHQGRFVRALGAHHRGGEDKSEDRFADRYSASDGFADRYSFAEGSSTRTARATVGDRTGPLPSGSFKLASLSPELPYGLPAIKQAQTRLIGFENSAFPYFGRVSESSRYSDNRVLVHVPMGFDVRKPGVIWFSSTVMGRRWSATCVTANCCPGNLNPASMRAGRSTACL